MKLEIENEESEGRMRVKNDEIESEIAKAIEKFNRYRSPEAKAEIVEFSGNSVKVKFSGVFCTSCGVYDYFDDLLWFGLNAEILGWEEKNESFIVTYLLK